MSLREKALAMHKEGPGKITVKSTLKVENKEQLSLAYTPGVAEPCREIE
ncbi:MAG TPA: NAD-dependent malic enzyme, partial [Bacillota bacterium]|nr:NAD-dependent malic enzyme [Bacillota bacterium]